MASRECAASITVCLTLSGETGGPDVYLGDVIVIGPLADRPARLDRLAPGLLDCGGLVANLCGVSTPCVARCLNLPTLPNE